MAIKYVVVGYIFNAGKFALDLRLAIGGNLTVTDVADAAGMSDTNIAKLMSGTENNLKMQTLLKICNTLDLNPTHYFELEDN